MKLTESQLRKIILETIPTPDRTLDQLITKIDDAIQEALSRGLTHNDIYNVFRDGFEEYQYPESDWNR